MTEFGENLIFLISQPRSGSTLLQRILATHPNIHTLAEPWLMLHPIYALRPDRYEAEYGSQNAWGCLQNFLRRLPHGEDEYIEGIRRMCSYLYECALEGSGKRYFLDKTPSYYFIIQELKRIFPKAQFIILFRNPLAILCSIINFIDKRLERLSSVHTYAALIRAPRLLLEAIDILGDRCVVIHYECLLQAPEKEVKNICDKLGLPFIPEMVEYGHHNIPRWQFGDQWKVYQEKRPDPENIGKWMEALDDPQIWRLARDYLQMLGQEVVEWMGYSYDELHKILDRKRPNAIHRSMTFSLHSFFNRRSSYSFLLLRSSIIRRGIWCTIFTVIRRTARTLLSYRLGS